jgi:hypothetical protein
LEKGGWGGFFPASSPASADPGVDGCQSGLDSPGFRSQLVFDKFTFEQTHFPMKLALTLPRKAPKIDPDQGQPELFIEFSPRRGTLKSSPLDPGKPSTKKPSGSSRVTQAPDSTGQLPDQPIN